MQQRYISVDVETAGPSPHDYSLLAIGACLVENPERTFYVELKPLTDRVDGEALAVSGLSLTRLAREGQPPADAMARFAGWAEECGAGERPTFVALNAPFDWMFVTDYLYRFVGSNPFGHSALDMKALFMGVAGSSWARTSMRDMAARYGLEADLPHHALHDAVLQAEVFRAILTELDERNHTVTE